MEFLVSLVQEVLHTAAERAASYRLGQSALRYMDRALWIVEKSARWAVPPPLDQDELPQPELIRPLPWVFFLALLVMLRITRESISLVNLALGKPPLRSADVVTYIQGKRRYLRTLKYQGNRMMRARSERVRRESWYSQLQSMFEFTMCFRRQHYGNNNTRLINGDEVLVVKRNKKFRKEASTVASTSETSMERLIEKMMADVDAESDESSYTLTNLTSGRSDRSDYNSESDRETGSNTKTQVKHSQDSKTVKETQENTSSETDSNTKTLVKQSQVNKTVKGTLNNTSACDTETPVKQAQDNTSLPAANTKIQVKQSHEIITTKTSQVHTLIASSTETSVKHTTNKQTEQSQDIKTVKVTQDNNNSLIAPDTKSPIKQSQDSKTAKQIQDNLSLTASNAETPVKLSQDNNTVEVKTSQVDKTVKQTEDISAKENNIATSTPKKGYNENSNDFYQSNDSMMRLDGDSDIKKERDMKEATMDFMQNEIGSHRSEGYSQYKIANGLMSTDLTATER